MVALTIASLLAREGGAFAHSFAVGPSESCCESGRGVYTDDESEQIRNTNAGSQSDEFARRGGLVFGWDFGLACTILFLYYIPFVILKV